MQSEIFDLFWSECDFWVARGCPFLEKLSKTQLYRKRPRPHAQRPNDRQTQKKWL
jgi:hypothetical protein